MSLLLSDILPGFNKHTSFLCYEIIYSHEKFYDTGSEGAEQSRENVKVGLDQLFNFKLDRFALQ